MYGGRTCDNRKYVRRVYLIRRNAGRNNLNFAPESNIEQGAHGPVDKARHEDFFILGAPFPFYKTAGNFSRGIIFFVVINGERYVIQAFLCGRRSAYRRDNGRTAVLRVHGAVRLFGNPARFQNQLVIADFICNSVNHLILLILLFAQTEVFNKRAVRFQISALQVFEQSSALTDQLYKRARRPGVFFKRLTVLGKLFNPFG